MSKWLTKEAERALRAADDEARKRRQAVGTPHLLLGLLADPRGRPADALRSMGLSVRQVQYEAARKLGRVTGKPARGRPERSTRVDDILGHAYDSALGEGRHLVEAEDILLALVAEPEGKAASILKRVRAVSAATEPEQATAAG